MTQPTPDIFQAIGDPSRRQILQLLSQDTLTINALAAHFEMSRPAVSKHIKILHSTGFIVIEDKGRERYCTLHRDGFQALQQWISFFDVFWQHRLKKLENLLDNTGHKSKGH
ncbi:ArsR family transcriptional regulator [Chitinophaga polysaccharea]|uniref:Helix-turn-helix transcriptional regulator n=2 Tax=Chitinophaga TaxID=79328 RepID=A0A847SS25_9BACT|nr:MULTISPECIES: metalloregulator ArsR/SmtB family transcription factor [Chitinophaga]NLR82405.1 helix-turn-helix transcriptional regulator [Chitinophaga eiseniae]TWF41725.1 ArsR family transcriptional regulator [Chitinophaga polysaccharea]